MSTTYSAAPSNLGYLYQTLYALLILLESKEEVHLTLEALDDIAFEKTGSAKEQLQVKHHIGRVANLTDKSADLWKTLRIWSTQFNDGTLSVSDTVLSLVTTEKASKGSIAAMLKPGNRYRDDKEIVALLTDVAKISTNEKLQEAFTAFLALSNRQQEELISCIKVIDGSPIVISLHEEIMSLFLGVRPKHRLNVYERLEGWWFELAIQHLYSQSKSMVSKRSVEEKIAEINDQFKPDALPIDFANAIPSIPPDPKSDNRRFVCQLKLIMINNRRIEKAIIDYYRAFEQRSKWIRENLLYDMELEKYEEKLVDEWERYCLFLKDQSNYNDSTDENCIEIGKKIYGWMEQEANFSIRERVTESYIVRGSYHILADLDQPKVWWHPKFVNALQKLLPVP